MKKTILIFLISFPFILSCQEINEKNNKVQFEVTGNCIMCKKRIEKAALLSKGVKYASWDIPSNQLTLIYNPKKLIFAENEIRILFFTQFKSLADLLSNSQL